MSSSRKHTGLAGGALVLCAVVGALVTVRVLAIVLILLDGTDHPFSILGGDARRYIEILDTPGTPYRDYAVEYPPLTLAFTELVRGSDLLATQVRLAFSQLLLELVAAGLLAWGWGRRAGLAFLVLGTSMVLYPVPYFRIDLLAVVLAVGAMALVKRRYPSWGGAVLGVAAFVKVWPLVLAPWLLLSQAGWPRAAKRSLLALVAVLTAGGLAWVLWAGFDGPAQVLSFRGASGWQIESVIGIFAHIADPAATAVEQGAWRTAAAVPGALRIGLPLMAIGTALAAWAMADRARRNGSPLAGTLLDGWAPLAGVTGLLVFSSIISPQYLLWLTPFAAIVTAASWPARSGSGARPSTAAGLWAGAMFMGAGALSALELAFIHSLTRGDGWAMGLVVARNALLVAMLVLSLAHLARSARRRPRRPRRPRRDTRADRGNGRASPDDGDDTRESEDLVLS